MGASISGAPAGAPAGIKKKRVRVVENVPSVDDNVERVVDLGSTSLPLEVSKVVRSTNKGGYLPGLLITVAGDVQGPSLDLALGMAELDMQVVPLLDNVVTRPLTNFIDKILEDVQLSKNKIEPPSYNKRGVEVVIL